MFMFGKFRWQHLFLVLMHCLVAAAMSPAWAAEQPGFAKPPQTLKTEPAAKSPRQAIPKSQLQTDRMPRTGTVPGIISFTADATVLPALKARFRLSWHVSTPQDKAGPNVLRLRKIQGPGPALDVLLPNTHGYKIINLPDNTPPGTLVYRLTVSNKPHPPVSMTTQVTLLSLQQVIAGIDVRILDMTPKRVMMNDLFQVRVEVTNQSDVTIPHSLFNIQVRNPLVNDPEGQNTCNEKSNQAIAPHAKVVEVLWNCKLWERFPYIYPRLARRNQPLRSYPQKPLYIHYGFSFDPP
jgi:hypothetical protein